jgi:hypothetical protein
MKEIHLHIGPEKTGTTSLQKYLKYNSEAFAFRGLNVVPNKKIPHWALPLLFSKGQDWNDILPSWKRPSAARKFSRRLSRLFQDPKYQIYIYSSELLFSRLRTEEEIELLSHYLQQFFDSVYIYFTRREPWDQAKSLAIESLKSGSGSKYLSQQGLNKALVANEYFFHACSPETLYPKWSQHFKRIKIIDYAEIRLLENGIISFFEKEINGLNCMATLDPRDIVMNSMPCASEIGALVMMNKRLSRHIYQFSPFLVSRIMRRIYPIIPRLLPKESLLREYEIFRDLLCTSQESWLEERRRFAKGQAELSDQESYQWSFEN